MTALGTPTVDSRPLVHASNAWNPTGRNLRPVPGCRLYYTHADVLGDPRTLVFLGSQRHLVFVADFEGHHPPETLRAEVIAAARLYPHLVDLEPARELPRVFGDEEAG